MTQVPSPEEETERFGSLVQAFTNVFRIGILRNIVLVVLIGTALLPGLL